MALLGVLQRGMRGDFEALSRAAGIDAGRAQTVLRNMRRDGVLASRTLAADACATRRARSEYALRPPGADPAQPIDALAHARAVWR